MSILLVDVGNSRTKLAVMRAGILSSSVSMSLDELTSNRIVALLNTDNCEGAYISNVAGARASAHLRDVLGEHTSSVNFLIASRTRCGVTNAYEVPEKLGSDRWAALIGARSLRVGAACVVSVGTAMTVDALDAGGMHLGGLIVPGPRLMVESLFAGTSDIAQRALNGSRNDRLLASDTFGAVVQGSELALASLIQRVCEGVQNQLQAQVSLVLTGGAAANIKHLLQSNVEEVPDLVLRGLAVIAQQQ